MGHKNNRIIDETIDTLKSMQSFGQSKYHDKINGCTQNKIYSYSTFNSYKTKCIDFIKYAKSEHHCKNVNEAKQYVLEYLTHKIESNYSPWTIKAYSSALSKLYGKSFSEEIHLPTRHRDDVCRSRQDVSRDKHFSIQNNKELINFCQHTGLRRSELESLRGKDIIQIDSNYYVIVQNGKGGKYREAPILNNDIATINKILNTPNNERVWGKVHSCADIHSYRRDYCNSLYKSLCPHTIPKDDRYYCRNDKKGIIYSRSTMEVVSKSLGHSRICVIAYSYLDK